MIAAHFGKRCSFDHDHGQLSIAIELGADAPLRFAHANPRDHGAEAGFRSLPGTQLNVGGSSEDHVGGVSFTPALG
jgi:hypothetical protein